MAILKRAQSSIHGLPTALSNINTQLSDHQAKLGDLSSLQTSEKTNLAGAINELQTGQGGKLATSQNLADLADAAVARGNLDVLSSQQITDAIDAAKLATGRTLEVADITARDALTDVTDNDRVFVADDGDGKWAIYRTYNSGWTKLADQDSLENAISATGIKTAYESNPDTNAFTDADKTKLDGLQTEKLVLNDQLVTDLSTGTPTDTEAPSAAAVKAYADAAASSGLIVMYENTTVSGDSITLAKVPKGGLPGVLNFATVRHLDGDGVAYDAMVLPTADSKVFDIMVDTPNQWDGKTVTIQYLAVA